MPDEPISAGRQHPSAGGGPGSIWSKAAIPEASGAGSADVSDLDAMTIINDQVERQRHGGRGFLGVGTANKSHRSLAAAISESGAGWYALLALGLFAALDQATGYIISAIGPNVSSSLGVSASTFTMIATQRQTLVGLTALNFAYIFYKRSQRAQLSKNFGVQYAVILVVASLLTWVPAFAFVIGGVGAGAAVVWAAHRPMVMDAYPPGARVRALSFHGGAAVVGAIIGPALVVVLSGAAGLSWRGVLVVIGLIFLPLALFGLRLRDPGYGRYDSDPMAGLMREGAGPGDPEEGDPGKLGHEGVETGEIREGDPTGLTKDGRKGQGRHQLPEADPTELTFWEATRRVWMIPTVRRLLAAWAVLGVAVTPLVTYQGFFLKQEFNLTTSQRALFYAGGWCLALPALWFAARHGERAWRDDPARLLLIAAGALVALAVGLLLAVIPVLGISLFGFSVVFAAEAVGIALLSMVLLSIVRPRARVIAAGLSAVFFGLVGGEGGSILLSSLASRYSEAVVIGILAVPALGAALMLRRAAVGLEADLDRVVNEELEDEGVRVVLSQGGTVPLLACKGIDFSYGQLQVLFGVDFAVRDGEMLALLGVNGAGKSTLLKVISGIGLPSAGSVRFRGSDITYVDAERRVRLGITQIPGGRAVFAPMTVIDNLRGLGYSIGKNRRLLEQRIDECFATFPILADRRNQPAATLSGGEQQMLGLCKAFILRPQLLLIDELSLGLAPIIVDRLLSMVREINAGGTAVVLVEQSVSLALSVVNHAYFMEKGEIRFDGSSTDLLVRDDLLRAVFLGAAASGGTGA
jgi:ABC-type branched-subunit amino acid transport system ATPase component